MPIDGLEIFCGLDRPGHIFYKKKAKYLLTKGEVTWKVFTLR